MHQNIYFSGKAGTGKTKLCEYLVKKYNYIQAKMAYPIYAICENYLGMKTKQRLPLQHAGTEVGRGKISEDIWVNRFTEDIWIAQETSRDLYNKEIHFCSDDTRFRNEHEALKEAGWVGIYLDSPEDIRIQRLEARDGDASVENLNHISELSIDEFKDELIKVDTSGSLEQAYENLEQTLEYIRREIINGSNN